MTVNGEFLHYTWTANINKTASIVVNSGFVYHYTFRWVNGAIVLKNVDGLAREVEPECPAYDMAKLMTEALKVAFMKETWKCN